MRKDDVDRLIEQRQALNDTPPCKTDPDAPHGFDRNASHSADRYVCECESWEPDVDSSASCAENVHKNVDNVNMSEKHVHKSDKFVHEWVGLTDEEIMEGLSSFNEYGNLNGFLFAQWIEAKLKEKNT